MDWGMRNMESASLYFVNSLSSGRSESCLFFFLFSSLFFFPFLSFIFLNAYLFWKEKERETEKELVGEGKREKGTEDLKQALH